MSKNTVNITLCLGDLFLNRMKTAKQKQKQTKKPGNQLAYVITIQILTKYCIIREIHRNILKIHVIHEPVLS